MDGLSIDQSHRWVDTRLCPTCPQPDDIVTAIIRKDGRALIGYRLRFHDRRPEAFVDIQFVEHEELEDFDGPDGYCAVFSCWIGNGEAVLIDAPAVSGDHAGWSYFLSRDAALVHHRHVDWREVLELIVSSDPVLRRMETARTISADRYVTRRS